MTMTFFFFFFSRWCCCCFVCRFSLHLFIISSMVRLLILMHLTKAFCFFFCHICWKIWIFSIGSGSDTFWMELVMCRRLSNVFFSLSSLFPMSVMKQIIESSVPLFHWNRQQTIFIPKFLFSHLKLPHNNANVFTKYFPMVY